MEHSRFGINLKCGGEDYREPISTHVPSVAGLFVHALLATPAKSDQSIQTSYPIEHQLFAAGAAIGAVVGGIASMEKPLPKIPHALLGTAEALIGLSMFVLSEGRGPIWSVASGFLSFSGITTLAVSNFSIDPNTEKTLTD